MEPLDAPLEEPKATTSPERTSNFREVPWRWSDVIIGLVPAAAFRLVPELIDPARLSAVPRWLWLPLNVLAFAWMLAYPMWIARRRRMGPPLLAGPRAILVEALWALLAVPVVMLSMSAVFAGLSHLLGESARPARPLEPIARSPHPADWLGLVVLAVTISPVAEEVFFRGMLYNALRRRLPTIVAVPLQAVVFGLMHPFGPSDVLAVALIGIALALLYEWRRTLVAPVLLHALVNTVGLAVTFAGIAAEANAPRLGVYGERHETGCRITRVVPGSTAEAAGLQVGDVVTALDGKPVRDIGDMADIVRKKHGGDTVLVEFIRDRSSHRVQAILEPLREQGRAEAPGDPRGMPPDDAPRSP
jgi:membrane protease YdiL (CAAX protease family)